MWTRIPVGVDGACKGRGWCTNNTRCLSCGQGKRRMHLQGYLLYWTLKHRLVYHCRNVVRKLALHSHPPPPPTYPPTHPPPPQTEPRKPAHFRGRQRRRHQRRSRRLHHKQPGDREERSRCRRYFIGGNAVHLHRGGRLSGGRHKRVRRHRHGGCFQLLRPYPGRPHQTGGRRSGRYGKRVDLEPRGSCVCLVGRCQSSASRTIYAAANRPRGQAFVQTQSWCWCCCCCL